MNEKQISKLHTELIQTKVNIMQGEIQKTINEIAIEMGIDLTEKWNVNPDFTKFIKEEKPLNA